MTVNQFIHHYFQFFTKTGLKIPTTLFVIKNIFQFQHLDLFQILPDHMLSVRKSLQAMEDVDIGCGPVGAPQPDEVVSVKWVDEDKAFNIG